ncbi:MAG TPA: hypothetical protein VFV31_04680, partial [Chitinophagaceae bacterium]|nr:hypothetical protein [Chitinophagaceae bacterium]
MKIKLHLAVVFLLITKTYAQLPIGQNEITSFSRSKYGAGAQNWAMAQDKNNRLYVANNEGLLVFDGTNWQIFPVPNKTIVRSIEFGEDGKLYTGAQDELGYFAPDNVGRLQFTSLKNLLPATERNFPDVWQIEVAGKEVFFRTNTTIFRLYEGRINAFRSNSTWLSMHKHQGVIV